jgi:hypothetical protein
MAGADARQRQRGREDAHGQALRTEPMRSEVDPEQWMVNPLMVPAGYNFLYFSQGRPCGRPPAAAVLGRQRHDGHRAAGLTHRES